MNSIKEIVDNIQKYSDICSAFGANLVLATKTVPKSVLQELAVSHKLIFAENRVQEFCEKYFESKNVTWQFIGRLQTNKVKYLVGKVSLIQSLDRVELAKEISRVSQKCGIVTNVLIEINLGESQKGGVSVEKLDELLSSIDTNINVCGVMGVLPRECDVEKCVKPILDAANLVKNRFNIENPIISIGMSNDYEICLNYGSNMIRLGTAIFGKR